MAEVFRFARTTLARSSHLEIIKEVGYFAMVTSNVWNAQNLVRKDLPRLQDLLKVCDRSLLKRVIVDDFVCCDKPPNEIQRKAFCKRLDASLDAMVKLPLSKKPVKNWVIVPREICFMQAHRQAATWRLHAALIPFPQKHYIEKLLNTQQKKASGHRRVKKERKRLRRFEQAAHDGFDEVSAALGERSYTLMPWEEVLACRVWLGGPWCCRERYVVLASAFWEMTFLGFEYERAQACAAQTKAGRMIQETPGTETFVTCQTSREEDVFLKNPYGLVPPDRFMQQQRERFARRMIQRNHYEQYLFLEHLLCMTSHFERRGGDD